MILVLSSMCEQAHDIIKAISTKQNFHELEVQDESNFYLANRKTFKKFYSLNNGCFFLLVNTEAFHLKKNSSSSFQENIICSRSPVSVSAASLYIKNIFKRLGINLGQQEVRILNLFIIEYVNYCLDFFLPCIEFFTLILQNI